MTFWSILTLMKEIFLRKINGCVFYLVTLMTETAISIRLRLLVAMIMSLKMPSRHSKSKNARLIDRLSWDQLMLEKNRSVTNPKHYKKQSQKHLDNFIQDLLAVFCSKLITYKSKKTKCIFAGNFFDRGFCATWKRIDNAIKANLMQIYS